MPTYSSDRREALKIIGAIGATCAYPFSSDELYGQTAPEHHHSPVPPPVAAPAGKPTYFTQADFQTISRIADLIIPKTDTPGAVEAGVPEYVDMVVGRNPGHQPLIADGLRWLDQTSIERHSKKKFIELDESQQLQILEPLCEAADALDKRRKTPARNVEFFALMKSLTADGYYTSRAGLVDELGYRGNTPMADFPDCTHEH